VPTFRLPLEMPCREKRDWRPYAIRRFNPLRRGLIKDREITPSDEGYWVKYMEEYMKRKIVNYP